MSRWDPSHFRVNSVPPYLLDEVALAVAERLKEGHDVIDLSRVNPNLPPPSPALDRLIQSILRPESHRYSASKGIARLRAIFCRWYAARYGVELDGDTEVCVTAGTKEGLTLLLMSVLQPGDSVLIPSPWYPIHASSVILAGAQTIRVPLPAGRSLLTAEDEDFFGELKRQTETSWPRPKALIVSFPHNPTTVGVDRSFWERLVHWARSEDVLIINDFTYAEVYFSDYRPASILSVPGAKEVAVEFYSLSKAFNMPGWRVGFCAGKREIVQALAKFSSYVGFGVFLPIQIGAIAALESELSASPENSYLQNMRATYEGRKNILLLALTELGWKASDPLATFFIWGQLPQTWQARGGRVFANELFRATAVAVLPGEGFGEDGASYVRFALVERESRLRTAVESLRIFMRREG